MMAYYITSVSFYLTQSRRIFQGQFMTAGMFPTVAHYSVKFLYSVIFKQHHVPLCKRTSQLYHKNGLSPNPLWHNQNSTHVEYQYFPSLCVPANFQNFITSKFPVLFWVHHHFPQFSMDFQAHK